MQNFAPSRVPPPPVFVLDDEYEPLADLVCSSERATGGIRLLWRELERASVITAGKAPPDLVRMGCRVHIVELDRRQARWVRLVYPREAAEPNLVSVTSGLGAALLGLRAGQSFVWRGADRRMRRIRVLEVELPLKPRIVRHGLS